jgi:hypothetical protein
LSEIRETGKEKGKMNEKIDVGWELVLNVGKEYSIGQSLKEVK